MLFRGARKRTIYNDPGVYGENKATSIVWDEVDDE